MTQTLEFRFFDLALWVAGFGHFIILFASFQVPFRLEWVRDLAQLKPFNRKLLWAQGSFTVLTIIAFGTFTLALHQEMLRGDRAATWIAGFIALYWTARILVDAFYFDHEDWPAGRFFQIGHFLLTSLFCGLASTFIGLLAWNFSRR
jgi:hypothetical protein